MSYDYDPRAHGAKCDVCPLRGNVVVPPDKGAVSDLELLGGKAVCIVGEAPGEQEERQRRPFVGPSGQELDRALRSAHLKRSQVWVTNALLCRPPKNKLKDYLAKISRANKALEKEWKEENKKRAKEGLPELGKPDMTPSPLDCCKPRLEEEIYPFQNFITTGKTGTTAVTGITASILAVRGGLTELSATERTPHRKVMPTVHPAFVLRQMRWMHVFRNDVAKAGRWFKGRANWVPPEVTYNPTPDVLAEFLSRDAISTFDLETDGIESLRARIRCVGIGFEDHVMVVGFLSKDGRSRFYDPQMEREVKDILCDHFENPTRIKCGHNAGYYDKIVLQQRWGINPTPIIDTMLLHRNVESELPHGLAYVGSMYTEAPSWKCYDGETEVLTHRGWVRFDALPPRWVMPNGAEEQVAVAEWDNGKIHFVEPSGWVNQPYSGPMWRLQNQATDLLVTPDHKMVYRPMHSTELKTCEVQNLPRTGKLPHTGEYRSDYEAPLNLTQSAMLRLLVAFQADGSWVKKADADEVPTYLDFGFTKKRKIERLKGILDTLGVPYKVTPTGTVNPRTRIWAGPDPEVVGALWNTLGPDKRFGDWLCGFNVELRRIFLDELPFWDGTQGKQHTNYNTSIEWNADWVQACAIISGRPARKLHHDGMWRVSLPRGAKRSRAWSKLEGLNREVGHYDGRIYCVSVPSGFLVVRRNGKVTISGNTDREGNKLSHDSETDIQLHEYCANDVAVTARVVSPLVDSVDIRKQTTVWQLDQKIQAICADMHTVGMYVDQKARLKEEKKLLNRRYDLLHEIRGRLGKPDFNPGSVYQLRDVLFEGGWNLVPPLEDAKDRLTSSGDPSTADLVLRALLTDATVPREQRDIIKLVRYYRKVQKVLGTYVVKLRPWDVTVEDDLGWDEDDDWVDRETRKKYGLEKVGIVDPRTGRMHPGWNAHVAVTGRLSSSKPINAMNFPGGMRGMVTAAPGHVLVGADMDQLELRFAAALWGVTLYLRAFAEGKDPHSMTAFTVFGDAFLKAAQITEAAFQAPGILVGGAYDAKGNFDKGFSDEAKKMRDLAKIVMYASQYMAKTETVHQIIGKTEVPARGSDGKLLNDGTTDLPYALLKLKRTRAMKDNWLKGVPEYQSGWNREISEYRSQGYLAEPVTHRRRDFLDGEDPNQIVNFKVQAGCAGLMNNAIIQLHEAIPLHKWGVGTGIINQCHDSIVIECPADGVTFDAKGRAVGSKDAIPFKVARLLEECMNQTHPDLPGVEFTASADIGLTWKQVG